MDIKSIKTKPYPDQKPGTSGLRKRFPFINKTIIWKIIFKAFLIL